MVFPIGDVERTRIVPWATYTIIALNIAAYVVQLTQDDRFTAAYSATPYEITRGIDIERPFYLPRDQPAVESSNAASELIEQGPVAFPVRWTLLTAQFLHEDPLHIAFNMLFLWIFGDNVEEVLGGLGFLAFYFVCGTVGLLAEVAHRPDSFAPILGASAAVAGVMGAYLVWFPRYHVRVLLIRYIIEVRAVWVIGLWILVQVLRELMPMSEVGGVAYLAHLAGAASGILAAMLLTRRAARFSRRFDPA